ncbi:MAG: hypothetical protein AB7R77_27165 [Ilumatobacteraceae bacterium]
MIVGVGSWRGIGASTTALAVAASLAARDALPWLVEADPSGGSLAVRLMLDPGDAGTLERLAFPTTRGTSVDRFADAAVDVTGMRVITAPGDPFRAWGCHTPRLAWQPMLRDLPGPVVIDLGRLHGGRPHAALLAQLDVLVLVTNLDTIALAATMQWADSLGKAAPGDVTLPLDITRVALVDAPIVASRVGRTEAETELGDRFAGWLPWAPEAVQLLHRGAPMSDRRMRRHALTSAVEHLVDRLVDWTARTEAA